MRIKKMHRVLIRVSNANDPYDSFVSNRIKVGRLSYHLLIKRLFNLINLRSKKVIECNKINRYKTDKNKYFLFNPDA